MRGVGLPSARNVVRVSTKGTEMKLKSQGPEQDPVTDMMERVMNYEMTPQDMYREMGRLGYLKSETPPKPKTWLDGLKAWWGTRG
jgi:hypothetical protein